MIGEDLIMDKLKEAEGVLEMASRTNPVVRFALTTGAKLQLSKEDTYLILAAALTQQYDYLTDLVHQYVSRMPSVPLLVPKTPADNQADGHS